MYWQRNHRNQLIYLRNIFVIIYTCAFISPPNYKLVYAGAASTPKNLVNLSAPSEGGVTSGTNLTTTSQFQNEYQFNRQSHSKQNSADRQKLSTPPISDVSANVSTTLDHMVNELDFSYSDGRVMTNVPDCKGRLRLNGTRGFITDGPGFYQTNLQCSWLIDSGLDNATIRIQIQQFNTECNYDFLYLFDGDSVYSPLVAALSGDMKDFSSAFHDTHYEDLISSVTSDNNSESLTLSHSANSSSYTNKDNSSIENSNTTSTSMDKIDMRNMHSQQQESQTQNQQMVELKTHSGKAFIYFHSDTAQIMPGFYMTYSIDSCPLDCSHRGDCDYRSLTCKCNQGYFGDGCQHTLCPNNCTSPIHGTCDQDKSCICNTDFTGADCSKRADQQHWNPIHDTSSTIPARAFHQAVIIDHVMWIFGGKSQALSNTNTGIYVNKKTIMILSYDLVKHRWNKNDVGNGEAFVGLTGQDHLAELSGHSVAVSGTKAFIYGGMAMNSSVLNTLTVFDGKTKTLSTISNKKDKRGSEEQFIAPLSVVGHSANIIGGFMYVFLGYNPLYGYLNFVQKFNIANNSWSIIDRRGSSVSGCIGHTSSYDPVNRLVYIFGGHNALRSSRLYSFDPVTEVWTYLHSGPAPRYYHSAIITNGLLTILGGNSYNTSHQSDQCFQQTHLVYDLNCPTNRADNQSAISGCGLRRKCWSVIDDDGLGVMKRHGHTVVAYNDQELILYGGFNGIIMNDLRVLKIQPCSGFTSSLECTKPRLGLACEWNVVNNACEAVDRYSSDQASLLKLSNQECSKNELKWLQWSCETRETCTDCLHTNLGCVWCGLFSQCQHNKCRLPSGKALYKPEQCYRDDILQDPSTAIGKTINNNNTFLAGRTSSVLDSGQNNELECKVDNCHLCQSKPYCSWQIDICVFSPPTGGPLVSSSSSQESQAISAELSSTNANLTSFQFKTNLSETNNSRHSGLELTNNKTALTSLPNSLLNSSPYHMCDVPCFARRSCEECTTSKCIWCSTTEQCIDSSAYFAYHAMGQCMHYVAYILKCSVASCSDIETCDKCLTNPRCGWLNDISNTGKGRCFEGNSSGPSTLIEIQKSLNSSELSFNGQQIFKSILPNWFYATCPSCQCNGHSYCRLNTSSCVQPCQDYTEGPHCDRCMSGYSGDPINGGSCRPCRCNGHAQTCNRETGKCYCSTKGIIGHNCNKCDDKNYYIGDPSSPGNGTCYYNLTTDYQYTFNMSKPEDHFYSDINFINVPIRKESDADFSIACSRSAFVNISSGTSYKNRRLIQSGLECGSFRLRFPHDRHSFNEANYSFFVHVYKFQTPFILQISFSQHRTLYLPQFFFTFSSCFLFFFALSGLVWKIKHEYDLYIRRQRQFIEMEQMARRPFSTILLEMFRPSSSSIKPQETTGDHQTVPSKQQATAQRVATSIEPTPISFEPCFGNNVGVLSLFVQLPGRPNLAIGSALVSLNDDSAAAIPAVPSAASISNCAVSSDSNAATQDELVEQSPASKRNRSNKGRVSVKNS